MCPLTSTALDQEEPVTRFELIALLLIVVLGAALRIMFLRLAPGFWYDEAIYALDGLSLVREPGWPIFFDTGNHMREPLFIYLLGLTHLFVEPSVLAARATATVVGVATIPVVWLLGREWRGAAMGLGAAFLFAVQHWHVHFSGLCFRTITSPLLAALVMLFLLRTLRTHRLRDALLAGACLGIGAYSYLSFRLFPFIVAAPVLWALWLKGREVVNPEGAPRTRLLRNFAALFAVAALIFLPLGIHFLRNPDHFSGRSAEVNFFAREDAGSLLLRQTRDVALMPLLRGDHVGKHNLPGPPRFNQMLQPRADEVAELWSLDREAARALGCEPTDPHGTGAPLFRPLAGLLFYLGLAGVLWESRRSARALALVAWLAIGSLASILSFGAPNMLRLLYLSPLAALLLAEGFRLARSGIERAAEALGARATPPRGMGWLAMLGTVVLLGNAVVFDVATQVWRAASWHRHPMVAVEFNYELAGMGTFLSRQPDRLPVRLPAEFGWATHPTLVYIADGYNLAPTAEQLGGAWWEFSPTPGLPGVPAISGARAAGRAFPIRLSGGQLLGDLVEMRSE